MTHTFRDLQHSDLATLRTAIRSSAYKGHTAGLGSGYLQANVVILPKAQALDFMRFCQRNPKPCPLVGVSDTGDPMMRFLGRDIDIRRDVPAYSIFRDGQLSGTATDISDVWTDDLVAFALGCSFTFEHALIRAGIPLWHVENDRTVPMFRSSIPCAAAGPFRCSMVVSLRAIAKDRVDQAAEISRRFPLAHGGPVHAGDPADIGIHDIAMPDWGDPAPLPDGHVPVFWACGVTPQAAIAAAAPPLCITHRPGHMLITDIPEDAEVPVLIHD
ncbi:putative hydro-lyase [Anianabacter salinae]|uniref:putative hydro-lyase n=1 Tax=Anianabacter salinae TaxID=2851023 RepID=UPI00225E1940|nr:putative hydro-lyase [Anianabacter salinae]MBV0914261.1 putative hydro-lyase [Anianabacter salinae]